MKPTWSSVLGFVIIDYLALKRALGRGYALEERVLADLDRFLSFIGSDLTPEHFAEWTLTQERLTAGVRRNSMRIVRNLCLYRRRREPNCFVPDLSQFPLPHQPLQPYIFTETDILRLLATAERLTPTAGSPLRGLTYRLAIVLLYTSGLRRGELVRLRVADYALDEHTVRIRETKFHKSRLIPLSEDGFREVDRYLATRRTLGFPCSSDSPLLWHRRLVSTGYNGASLGQGIRALLQIAGIRTASGRLPRVHDFRHAFAVGALVRWYQAGLDVQSKLPLLATYMGHVSIQSTEHYLQFVEGLRIAASERFMQRFAGLLDLTVDTSGGAS